MYFLIKHLILLIHLLKDFILNPNQTFPSSGHHLSLTAHGWCIELQEVVDGGGGFKVGRRMSGLRWKRG